VFGKMVKERFQSLKAKRTENVIRDYCDGGVKLGSSSGGHVGIMNIREKEILIWSDLLWHVLHNEFREVPLVLTLLKKMKSRVTWERSI
jgi:hypothetical protein